ncbi:MAG: sugar ABC transporter permease [Clostridia bacterium]|nr:sugar ABC transporter permease [Clostridia bacterium]
MKHRRMSLTTRLSWTGFGFVTPFVIGFLFFFLKPLWQSITFIFNKVDVTLEGYQLTFTGWENLEYVLRKDATFSTNLIESVTNLLWQVPVIVVFALFFAIIINQKFRGRVVVRAVFFLPVIIASSLVMDIIRSDAAAGSALAGEVVAGGTVSQSDALQDLLTNSGLSSDFIKAITTVTDSLFDLTWRTGVQMIIFLAGLQSIPTTLYEASAIEGATAWESFWKITLPMLTPIMLLNLVYTIVDNFTDTGNKVMVQVMDNNRLVRYGWTAAMSWIYFLIIAVVLMVVFFIFRMIERNNGRSKY